MRCVLLLSLLIPTLVVAQPSDYPPQFDDAREEVYKTIDGIELKLWVFEPPDLQPGDARAAIVFFFGGGWIFSFRSAPQDRQSASECCGERQWTKMPAAIEFRHHLFPPASAQDIRTQRPNRPNV